ncbi:MAG: hypothetical protein AB1716_05765 [Planctomycetota bacterium]
MRRIAGIRATSRAGRLDLLAAILATACCAALAAGQGRPPILWFAAGHARAVTALDLAADGTLLASASEDKTVKLWSCPAGVLLRTLVMPYSLTEQGTEITDARFTPDGAFIAVVMNHYHGMQVYSGKVRLFRVSDGALTRVFDGHSAGVSSVDRPDGVLT